MIERLTVDVAIVGGGTAGCSAALQLRRHGLSVCVLEKGLVGSQASGVNFGGVRQQGRHFAELPLARRAREIWSRLKSIVGTDCEFVPSGHIKLARSQADMEELERYARSAGELGLSLQLIGRNRVMAEYPWLGEGVVGLSLASEDGQANPRLVAPAFGRAARAAGAEIREGTRVMNAAHNGRRFQIRCETGLEVNAGFLVNTAGAWAGEIAQRFREPVPISTIAPNMMVTEPLPHFMTRSIGVCGGDVYLRQVQRGNVVFGGGGGWVDLGQERARPLAQPSMLATEKALALVPALRGALVIRTWTGIEGQMPDLIPVIGFSRTTPNLVHAFGFSGHGFQLGPVIGIIIDELIRTGRSESPLDPFDIGRFAEAGRTAGSSNGAHQVRN
ncbi:MAG TPA: FAD-binding oxidoreductase [Stellaceae bacterium]|nr:FAD-binding oxidoreductase [Stellaceae bacterium]